MTTKPPSCSILVPIYNTSDYLDQALNSLIEQTLSNLEIICINDGSTDNSLDIINKYAKRDKRIIVINKPNSGYGDSLNQGLGIAHGQYVAILEPDDWYEPGMLETLYMLASQNNLDVVKADFYQYSNRTRRNNQYHLFKAGQCNRILNSNQDTFIYSLQPSIWSAIYRRSFLNKYSTRFLDTPGASYQDTSFNFKVFALAKRVMFVDKPLLHYRVDNAQSSINNIAKKLPYIDKEYDEIDNFIIKNNLSQKLGSIAVECRYRTYVWAMEQLPITSINSYIIICANKLKQSLSSHKLQRTHNDSYALIMSHPHQYALQKTCRLARHRLKQKICPKNH